MVDVEGIEAIAGVAAFLAALPADRWAVVTSAPRELALRRIAAAGLPPPPLMIAAEDVDARQAGARLLPARGRAPGRAARATASCSRTRPPASPRPRPPARASS